MSRTPVALVTLSVLLTLTTLPADAASEPTEVVIGEVTVKEVPDVGLNVIVNHFDDSGADSVAENVYLLQTKEPPTIELPIHLDAAQLVAKQDQLVVVSLDSAEPWALGFFLSTGDPDEVEQLIRGIQQKYYGVASPELIHFAAGYGLARHSGQFNLPLDRWPPAADAGPALREKSSSGDVASQASCTTGGPGSSSASITCINGISDGSVTCQAGYYACCSCTWYGQAECNCEAESSGGGGGDCGAHRCEPFDET